MIPNTEKMFSVSAEAAVLGSMLIEPLVIGKVLPLLPRDEFFFLLKNRVLYNALVRMYVEGRQIDAVLLRDELDKRGQLKDDNDDFPSVQYIGDVLQSTPIAANSEYYSRIVAEKYQERLLLTAVGSINKISADTLPLADRIENIQALAFGLNAVSTETDVVGVDGAANVLVKMLDGKAGVIPTGFEAIDGLIQGLSPGQLGVIAGRPSMGKSGLMLGMALSIARAGTGVLIFSLEMSEQDLIERAICSDACVDMSRAKQNKVTSEERESLCKSAVDIEKLPLLLNKTCDTVEQQIALIRRLKQTHKVGCVFVDYIQLMHTARRTDNRVLEIDEISRTLKLAAMRENLPIVALSQLNREVERRDGNKPRLSDLRDSGSIEQDADVVLLLYRNDYYHPQAEKNGVTEVIVAKQRNGPTGTVRLCFIDTYAKFASLLQGTSDGQAHSRDG